MKKINSLVLVVVAGIFIIGCVEPGSGEKEKSSIEIETWFNYPEIDPNNPGEVIKFDYSPETKLIDLIDRASKHSDIYISLYLVNRPDFTNALQRAALERGVKVRIQVEDGWKTITKKQKKLINQLEGLKNASGQKAIEIVRCMKGCKGRVINHNKFFLFSKVGDDENIVVQSSANLTPATGKLYENTVVITGDKKLYDGFLNYWQDMADGIKDPNYFKSFESTNYPAEGSLKAYLFPQAKGDKLLDILNDISCDKGPTIVKATVSNWDSSRDLDARLNELATQGCDVSVIVPDNLAKTGCDVRLTMYPNVSVYTGYKLPHSKYVLVEGSYKGQQASIVWTGSHNYSRPALRSTDEVLLEVIDRKIVKEFVKNFDIMRENSIADLYSADGNKNNSCESDYQAMTTKS